MSFTESIRTCFQKYITFSGRAQRSEFWWWVLFIFASLIVLSFIDSMLFGTVTTTSVEDGFGGGMAWKSQFAPLSNLFSLATLLPGISVAVRRLHDKDKSGWWYWLFLVPIVGFIILIVWFATRGTEGPNRFGPDPLGGAGAAPADDGFADSSIPSVNRDDD